MSGAELEAALTRAGLGDILRQGAGAGNVQRFPNRELSLQLGDRDWMDWLVCELGKFRTELSRGPAKMLLGVRAEILPEHVAVEWGFADWLGPFQAGQLFAQAQIWHETFQGFGHTVPGKLKKWLIEGYSCFIHLNRLKEQPKLHKIVGDELRFAQKQATEWVEMGALVEVTGQVPRDHIVCNTVVAYRNNVMDRICWAGGPLNEGVTADKFRMENVAVVLRLLRPGDFMFSFDLKKGYFQVALKPDFQKFALMRVGHKVYKWKVLMFGLSCAPKDFSFIVKAVLALLRERGHRVCFYIDDIIGMAGSEKAAAALRTEMLQLFHTLGFFVSWKKSLLGVGQVIRHLGLDICSVDRSVWVPDDKVMAVKSEAACMLRGEGGELTGRRIAALVGKILSWRWACPAGLVLTRGLQKLLEQLPGRWERSKEGKNGWRLDYAMCVELTDWARAELRVWAGRGIWKLRSSAFRESTEVIAFVDACPTAGGAVVAERIFRGTGSPAYAVEELRTGGWEEALCVHSSVFELFNLWSTVKEFAQRWQGRSVHILNDNVGAVYIAGRGCLRNVCLHALAVAVLRECWRFDIKLSLQYLSGEGIIESGADGLSRGADVGDCMLVPRTFARLYAWKWVEVDLFCAPEAIQRDPLTGSQLEAVSPYPVNKQLGWDGLQFCSQKRLYAFPPTSILLQFLARAVAQKLRVVVVGPVWSQAPWWPLVVDKPTLELGLVANCIKPGQSGVAHPFGYSYEPAAATQQQMRAWAFNM